MSYRFNKKLCIRIVVATWGLAGFLLVNYYNSLCISFLAIPITKPLIESIQELKKRPEIQLVMDKNRNIEALFLVELVQSILYRRLILISTSQSAESGLLKELADRIRAYPGSLCNESRQCVNIVKGGRAVYTGVNYFQDKHLILRINYLLTTRMNSRIISKHNLISPKRHFCYSMETSFLPVINFDYICLK